MGLRGREFLVMRMKPWVAEVIQELQINPGQWTEDSYKLFHRNGVAVWTANGFHFLALYKPRAIAPGFLGKIPLWWAIKNWRRQVVAPPLFGRRLRNVDPALPGQIPNIPRPVSLKKDEAGPMSGTSGRLLDLP